MAILNLTLGIGIMVAIGFIIYKIGNKSMKIESKTKRRNIREPDEDGWFEPIFVLSVMVGVLIGIGAFIRYLVLHCGW